MINYKSKQNRNLNGKKYSKEEYSAYKEKERNDVYALVDEAVSKLVDSSDEFKAYLDTQSKFDRYSVANALLIKEQYPNAIQLRDYKEWGESGVQVKRGANSISILEPIEYTRKDGSSCVTYKVKKMFDVSQTNSHYRMTKSVNRDATKLVKALLETSNIDYQAIEHIPDDRAAFFDTESATLYIKVGVGDATKLFQEVARELSLAEIFFNCDRFNRTDAQFSADCASYMICKKYGVDVKGIDVDKTPLRWKVMEHKDIREELTMARDSLNELNTKLYFELNKDRGSREQQER